MKDKRLCDLGMQHITVVDGQKTPPGRVEMGVLQFNDDWPGVFIRGDNAFGYALYLRAIIESLDETNCDLIMLAGVKGLLSTLESCNVNSE